jgi:hypothetical protein
MYAVAARIDGTKYWKKLLKPKLLPPKKKAATGRALAALPKALLPKKIGPLDLYTVQIPRPRWALWGSQLSATGRRRLTKLRLEVLPELCAAGIPSEIVPLPKDAQNGGYWMDLAWDWALQKVGYPSAGDNGPVVICVLWLGVNPSEVSKTKTSIAIQQIFAKKAHRVLLGDRMRAAFGKAFKWDGKPHSEMLLSLI